MPDHIGTNHLRSVKVSFRMPVSRLSLQLLFIEGVHGREKPHRKVAFEVSDR